MNAQILHDYSASDSAPDVFSLLLRKGGTGIREPANAAASSQTMLCAGKHSIKRRAAQTGFFIIMPIEAEVTTQTEKTGVIGSKSESP